MQCVLSSVESDELCPCRASAHHNTVSFHFREVKTMERLTNPVKDEIGDVNYIVDGTLADGGEKVFKPFGRLLYLYVADCDTL